jgi:uncharacterized protein (TIGR02679 family)
MSTVEDRLRRVLGGEGTRWVLDRVRARLERGQELVGPISLGEATPEQRRAIETLFGRPARLGRSVTVSLSELDALVRRSGLHADGLAAAVVALTGPITLRSAVRDAELQAWQQALEPLVAVVDERPILRPWYDDVTMRGLMKGLCRTPPAAAPVAEALARLLRLLPVAGISLGQLASKVAGDSHALDHGRPLSTLAQSAIGHTWWTGPTGRTSSAQQRRAYWDCVGVVTDELSSTVLALNLSVTQAADNGLARLLAAADAWGEPLVLTLRQLTRHRVTFVPGLAYVCENPSVVLAAAERLGPRCPPLVCAGGQPTAAVHRLLSQLGESGCTLRYHGDFDWGGIRIANLLWSRHAMQPWRFDTRSYLMAAPKGGRALSSTPTTAVWDPELADAITAHGVRIEEEAVIEDLLADLAS